MLRLLENYHEQFPDQDLPLVYPLIYIGDFLQYAEYLLRWVRQLEEGDGYDYPKSVIKYAINNIEGRNLEKLITLAKDHLSHTLGEETMTLAQQLIQQGMQQGMQQGEYNMLLHLIKQKFSSIPESYEKRLQATDADTLLDLAERLMHSNSLNELFDET